MANPTTTISTEDVREGDQIKPVGNWGEDLASYRTVTSIEENGGVRIFTLDGKPFDSPLGGNRLRVRRLGQVVDRRVV